MTVSVDLKAFEPDSASPLGSDLGREMGMEWWVLKEVVYPTTGGAVRTTGSNSGTPGASGNSKSVSTSEGGGGGSDGGFAMEEDLTVITFNERVFPQSVSFLAGYG